MQGALSVDTASLELLLFLAMHISVCQWARPGQAQVEIRFYAKIDFKPVYFALFVCKNTSSQPREGRGTEKKLKTTPKVTLHYGLVKCLKAPLRQSTFYRDRIQKYR